jgi:hypothetical protein
VSSLQQQSLPSGFPSLSAGSKQLLEQLAPLHADAVKIKLSPLSLDPPANDSGFFRQDVKWPRHVVKEEVDFMSCDEVKMTTWEEIKRKLILEHPSCCVAIGPSGVGKTRAIRDFCEHYFAVYVCSQNGRDVELLLTLLGLARPLRYTVQTYMEFEAKAKDLIRIFVISRQLVLLLLVFANVVRTPGQFFQAQHMESVAELTRRVMRSFACVNDLTNTGSSEDLLPIPSELPLRIPVIFDEAGDYLKIMVNYFVSMALRRPDSVCR